MLQLFVVVLACCHSILTPAQQTENDGDNSESQIIRHRGEIFTTRIDPSALAIPPDSDAFQFAIYGDRTGGNPSGLRFLRQAVTDTNLLDPDFVMTVGDLIQGYNRPDEWMKQMKEFRAIMSGLKMNWFPVAGNHDIYWDFRDRQRPAIHHESNFEKHFGPLWYSFQHKGNGFVVLFSDEGNKETGEKGFQEARLQNMSPEQLEFLEKALEQLDTCKHVFVFLHHPRWLGGGYDGSNWPDVHQRLVKAGNVSAVFGGHIHHMTFEGPIDGIEYYTLGATGAHLAMDSPELGYLHHFNVVTVRDESFSVATLPVGAVIDPKTFKTEFLADVELVRKMRPKRVGEKIALDQSSGAAGGYMMRFTNPGQFPIEVTVARPNQKGWQVIPDHQHIVVPPGKTEGMKFQFFRAANSDLSWSAFSIPVFSMSVDYLHSSARIRLPEIMFPIDVTLSPTEEQPVSQVDRCLKLRGKQSPSSRRQISKSENDSAIIYSSEAVIAQGPFTVEAWVNPTDLDGSRAVIAKTQSSEYALFLHDGRTTFDVHLGGRYISPQADKKIPLNTWSHIAGVYDGKNVSLFIDGKLTNSINANGVRTTNDLPLFVGADPDGFGNPTREFAGRIDEVRLSNGARYSGEFEPATKHLRDDDTVLLLHMDQSFGPFLIDDSKSQATAIMSGEAEITSKN